MRSLSLLAVLTSHLALHSLASPFSPLSLSNHEQDTSPYLSFPHLPRHGSAFLPSSSSDSLRDLDQLSLLSEPTNPAPAYNRHSLSSQDSIQPIEPSQLDKRDVVSRVNLPFPPSAWIDINDLSTLARLSQAAVARMQTWYKGGQIPPYQWTGWWQAPVLGIAYTNLDLALGNRANELVARDLLTRNDHGTEWMIDKYVDDQSWWAMFALRAYQAYGNETWLDMVKIVSDNNTRYWDETCGGGVLWLTYRPLIKNTITNGLYLGILTRLYRYTGNSTYFDQSVDTLNWWLDWAFDPSNGRVLDTITATSSGSPLSSCTTSGEQTWTYNSGAFLFGITDLYYATGNTRLLDLGRTLAYAAIRDFTDQSTGILTESCENDPPPGEDLPPGCQQDETVFKGILMLGLAELYVARPDPNIYNFINTQLLSNVYNNVDDTWLFGMWWGGPWNETTAGPKTQINALCLISAAATINADFLSRSNSPGLRPTGSGVTDQIAVPTGANSNANNVGAGVKLGGNAAVVNGAGRVGIDGKLWMLVVGLVVSVGLLR